RVLALLRQRLDVLRFLDDLEAIAEPLHRRARDERRSFECVVHVAASELPGDRRDQSLLREDRNVTGVHEQERSRSVSALRGATLEARLAEERRLLVARDSRDRNSIGEDFQILRDAEVLRARPD